MISEFILTLGRVFWSPLRARMVRIEKGVELTHTPRIRRGAVNNTNVRIKVGTGNTLIIVDGVPAFLWIVSDLDWDATGDL